MRSCAISSSTAAAAMSCTPLRAGAGSREPREVPRPHPPAWRREHRADEGGVQERHVGGGHVRHLRLIRHGREPGGEALKWPASLGGVIHHAHSRWQSRAAPGRARARPRPARRPHGRRSRSRDGAAWSRAIRGLPWAGPCEWSGPRPARHRPPHSRCRVYLFAQGRRPEGFRARAQNAPVIDGALGGPVDQDYLLQAREMQAMSFAVHIPLVCFGIAFPAMVVFLEGLWLRTGDPLLQGARQALVQGHADPVRDRRRDRHDPVVRDGPPVAGVHGHLRRRVRARLRDRGLLVLHGGDLHRDLRVRVGPPVAEGPPRGRLPDDRRPGSPARSW